jgi:hypothetical protein
MDKGKKGISVVVGYVLLVSLGIVMAVIVFAYLKTYIPKELASCPAGSALFLEDYSCSGNQLNLTLKNSGKFNLGGFFIHGGNESLEQLATYDLSGYLDVPNKNERLYGTVVVVNLGQENLIKPNEKSEYIFSEINVNNLDLVEILPIRFEDDNGKKRVVSCTDSRIRETITCS